MPLRHAVVLVCVVALTATAASAQVQTRRQQDCVIALNRAAADLAAAETAVLIQCVEDAAAGKLAAAGATIDACVARDAGRTVAKARAALATQGRFKCGEAPSFGPTVAALDASFSRMLRLEAVFGADLEQALIGVAADRRGATCQLTVVRSSAAIAAVALREFNACKAAGLRDGTITSPDGISACIGADPDGRVAKVVAYAQRTAEKRCATTAVATAFPGECSGAPLGGLFACLERRVACDVCLALRAGDGAPGSCHRFVDGVATPYCGERPATTQSVARQWDEVLLDAIRIDTPRPTVHARNLFHLSAVMYDAWRAYGDDGSVPYLTAESPPSSDVRRDRETAISFAAYRLLQERFRNGPGAARSQAAFVAKMADLGYDPTFDSTAGDSPAAVGTRIAAAMIAYGLVDGANEANDYADDTGYASRNPPLIVKEPGTVMADPNHWQPLALDAIATQNGIPLPDKVQTYVSPNWNDVRPFALARADPRDVYVDLGAPPMLGEPAFRESFVQVLRFSSSIDPSDGATVDLSPAVRGRNDLGTNDGTGRGPNPLTGEPYPANVVKRADFGRALAEFWADGPSSETPPGHWNVIANAVSDDPRLVKRLGGTGPVLDDLEWDVKLYLALNGAVHDAAVAAWGLKRKYDSVRPISAIRYMAGLGQSSDPTAPSYDPNGLPLEDGFIELITPASSAPGERHAQLAPYVGEVAVRAWPGQPADPKTQVSGVQWIRARSWVPYQRATFVTPAFPGFISGHSTFSRAAATVLDRFTGSPFFPGGLGHFTVRTNTLIHELGPTTDVDFQWASYYDAADDAGISRLWGGIHIAPDDFTGRRIGAIVGAAAFERATAYFDGAVMP